MEQNNVNSAKRLEIIEHHDDSESESMSRNVKPKNFQIFKFKSKLIPFERLLFTIFFILYRSNTMYTVYVTESSSW